MWNDPFFDDPFSSDPFFNPTGHRQPSRQQRGARGGGGRAGALMDPFSGMGGGLMGFGGDMGMGGMMERMMQGQMEGGTSMSFSSFSSSSMGPDGRPVTIQRQYSTTTGIKDGVRTQHTQGGEYDSRYGGQMRNKRTIVGRDARERSHEQLYRKNLEGREERLTNMTHLNEENLQDFENEWRASNHPAPRSIRLNTRGGGSIRASNQLGLGYDPQGRGSRPRSSRPSTQTEPEVEVIEDLHHDSRARPAPRGSRQSRLAPRNSAHDEID